MATDEAHAGGHAGVEDTGLPAAARDDGSVVAGRRLPRHVALIMDGNGRWAKRHGLERLDGHREGAESVRAITTHARKRGIRTLTLYAFSEQNWARPRREIEGLMKLLVDYLVTEVPTMNRNGIRLRAIGNLPRLPLTVRAALNTAMLATAHNRDMDLVLALSYGGREEIVAAARRLAGRVARGELEADRIDEAALDGAMWTRDLAGPPDLIVRTSGEQRLSNFLLWQCAYAELCFVDDDWPAFREEAFDAALATYARRQRRFGRVGEQVEPGAGPDDRSVGHGAA